MHGSVGSSSRCWRGQCGKVEIHPLSHASTATDISIGEVQLKDIGGSVHIFHGTEDEVVDVDTLRKIIDAVSDGEITEVEDTGHSFSGVESWLAEESLKEIESI